MTSILASMTAADPHRLLLRILPPVEPVGGDCLRLCLPVQETFLSRDLPAGSAQVLRRGRQLAFTGAVLRNAASGAAHGPGDWPVCAHLSAQYALRELKPC